MDRFPVHRLFECLELTESERAVAESLHSEPLCFARHRVIRREGEAADEVFLLHSGWAVGSVTDHDGSRHIVRLHLPGEMLGTPSLATGRAVQTLTAITPVIVSKVPLDWFARVFRDAPRLAASLFIASQQKRVMLIDRIAAVGRTDARNRLAALLLNIHDRLSLLEPDREASFELPLTQAEIADMVGLTPVHVNRTLKELKQAGLIATAHGSVTLLDVDALRVRAAAPKRAWTLAPNWLMQLGQPHSCDPQ